MSRYIDADALMNKTHYTDDFYETRYVEWEDIELAPTADAVPVVRCRECRWRHDDSSTMWLPCMEIKTSDDWFCADGERRTDEQQT